MLFPDIILEIPSVCPTVIQNHRHPPHKHWKEQRTWKISGIKWSRMGWELELGRGTLVLHARAPPHHQGICPGTAGCWDLGILVPS